MGAILKFSGKSSKASSASGGKGKVVAYPGVNMREIEGMFRYLQRRDADAGRRG